MSYQDSIFIIVGDTNKEPILSKIIDSVLPMTSDETIGSLAIFISSGDSNDAFLKTSFINLISEISFFRITVKSIKEPNWTGTLSADEIILVGSGKGVVNVSSIPSIKWFSSASKTFNRLLAIYKKELKKWN